MDGGRERRKEGQVKTRKKAAADERRWKEAGEGGRKVKRKHGRRRPEMNGDERSRGRNELKKENKER